ncbi:MAG: hypothetical protein HIU92_21270 [Proteobacteria bacterium]|nr:hypothetical protein [Pseudomonadota bacterium]
MMIERLPGASNVVRFPIEERGRPTIELMRMLSPDVRTLDLLAEGYGLEFPPADFRDRVDAEAAAHIANHIDSGPGAQRSEQLRLLLDALVVAAVEAGRASRRAWGVVGEGRRQVAQARREGGSWVQALEEQLNGYELKAAKSSVEAHLRAEEAEGVARAVHLALAGETWTPRDVAAEMDALMAG